MLRKGRCPLLRPDRDQILDPCKRRRADAGHVRNLINGSEWPVGLAVRYDALCRYRPDARGCLQLRCGDSIDVDLDSCCLPKY